MFSVNKMQLDSTSAAPAKYKLIGGREWTKGVIIYRVKALRDFGSVKAGTVGGFVESEANLSHSGNCWIYDDAIVLDSSEVKDDARVCGSVEVSGGSIISGSASVSGDLSVYGHTKVLDFVVINGSGGVCNSIIEGNAQLLDNILVHNSRVSGNVIVSDDAEVSDGAELCGNVTMQDQSFVRGKVILSDDVHLEGESAVLGEYKTDEGNVIFRGAVASISGNVTLRDKAAIIGSTVQGILTLDHSMCIYDDNDCQNTPAYVEGPYQSLTLTKNGFVTLRMFNYELIDVVCFPQEEWSQRYAHVAVNNLDLPGNREFIELFNRLMRDTGRDDLVIPV